MPLNLLDKIIAATGLKARRTSFVKPPKETYLVWFDNVHRYGADLKNMISEHSVSFEVYAYNPDDNAEEAVEAALDEASVEWSKTDRQFIKSEQLYMTIYDFSFTEKE